MKSLFCVVGLSGTNGGNAKDIGARLDMIESTTGRSRPDFRGLAPLSTVHRSFGRSTSILQRGQVKRVTSEPRKMHSHFMERSSKGSCQENSSRREREARPILSTQPAYDARFASDPRHGRGDTAYFAGTPVMWD